MTGLAVSIARYEVATIDINSFRCSADVALFSIDIPTAVLVRCEVGLKGSYVTSSAWLRYANAQESVSGSCAPDVFFLDSLTC